MGVFTAEPSITNALDPALNSKIKDMVFVEVPVCVDHTDANGDHPQGRQGEVVTVVLSYVGSIFSSVAHVQSRQHMSTLNWQR